MEKVTFYNKNGDQLMGVLHKNGVKQCKYVIMVHGFTGDKDEKGLFIEAANFLINKGYSVLRFDIRGSGESEGDFSEVGINDQKEDFLVAVDFLKKKEKIRIHVKDNN